MCDFLALIQSELVLLIRDVVSIVLFTSPSFFSHYSLHKSSILMCMEGAYILSETPGSKNTQQDFPTDFHKYPGGVEYFDVYSPEIVRNLVASFFCLTLRC